MSAAPKLRHNRNVVFACHYHVVWCVKYRRPILKDGIAACLKKLLHVSCHKRHATIIELEVMPDHVHLLVSIDPQFGIHRLIKYLKGATSHTLRHQFKVCRTRVNTLWTNSYFVATVGGAPLKIVKEYIENQKHV